MTTAYVCVCNPILQFLSLINNYDSQITMTAVNGMRYSCNREVKFALTDFIHMYLIIIICVSLFANVL